MTAPPDFDTLMAPLGPFEPRPQIAVAVSGGADSLALALLADAWARGKGGAARGLIVDHGLRAESAGEARATQTVLASRGIGAKILVLEGLARGPALPARARAARYAALTAACAADGILHLLLGHHAADQAETVAMRLLAGSGPAGLAAMPALAETAQIRLLRPLLTVPPVHLRALLTQAGIAWAEDPSNADPVAQRARLRLLRRDRDGTGPATRASVAGAAARGRDRAALEMETADILARRVMLAPEGYALVTAPLPAPALSALIRTISGRDWPPPEPAVAALARAMRPATLSGVRILPAGKLPGDWLVVREPAALSAPVPALAGALWDRRFRLDRAAMPPPGAEIAALGGGAARLRGLSDLPAAILRVMPALWCNGKLAAVPHLDYPDALACARCRIGFIPGVALAGAGFVPVVVD